MDIIETIKQVEESEVYKAFKEEAPEYYFVHAFSMHVKGKTASWQLGYYSPKKEKMIAFTANPVEQKGEDEPFNKGETIKPLDMAQVKLSGSEAEQLASTFQKEEYPTEQVNRVIAILQHLEQQVFNITFVTNTFNTINIHVDAASGSISHHKLSSIMSLRKSDESSS